MIKAILVDDEKHCTDRLQHLLLKHSDIIHVIAVCHNIEAAKTNIEKLNPDLVFLDIQLNEDTAFALLKRIKAIKFQIILNFNILRIFRIHAAPQLSSIIESTNL